MRPLFFLVAIAILALGHCAEAGIIINASAMIGNAQSDDDTLLAFASAAEGPVDAPIQVESSEANSLQGLPGNTNSSVAPEATLLHTVPPPAHPRLQWRVELANATLPPSPDLDGHLKPS